MDKISTDFSTLEKIQAYFGPTPCKRGKEKHWRMRARLATRSGKIGLFLPGTHKIEDLIDCPDHYPTIDHAAEEIRKQTYIPYNEESQTGDLRYIQVTASREEEKTQLVLVANGLGKCDELAKTLWETEMFHSIWINTQEGSTNVIFGPTWKHLYGPRYLPEKLLGKPIAIHPACFLQANLELFEKILEDLLTLVPQNTSVTEYYSGFGAISLTLAEKIASSCLVEINPFAKEAFEACDPPKHLQFLGKMTREFTEVLIVDPPRKGLDPSMLDSLDPVHQILYLSCNFATLKRDCELLKERGWKVEVAKCYALFPRTEHLEILVSLTR